MRRFGILFILLISIVAHAQTPEEFYCRYGGAGEDIGYSAKQILGGHYIIAGSSSSYGTHGNTDVYLLKLDKFGYPSWEKFFGGSGNEVGKSVIQLPDSGYMIAGYTDSYGAGGFDAFIIRTDKDGTQLWQRTFGGIDWDFASDLVQAIDGNIYVVGNTYSFGNGKKDGFILKYDMSGNLLTQKFMGGAEDDELRSIIVTNDFQLATVGYTESRGEINGDGYFAKMDLNCDTIFTRTFGGPYKDYACDLVQQDNSQNLAYFIGGAKTYTSNGKTHSYMHRISSTGAFISDSSNFKNKEDEAFVSVAVSKHHSYLTAFARSVVVGSKNMQEEIFVTYINGFEYAINDAGEKAQEFVYSVEATADKGYISVGSTNGLGGIGNDIFVIKRDSNVIRYQTVIGLKEQSKKIDYLDVKYMDDNIHINFPENDRKKIELFNLIGVKVKELETSEKAVTLPVSFANESIFILKVLFESGEIYSKKFFKQ